jgi:sodium/proline symporter
MSTVDSQLLVCASCITHDLGLCGRSSAAMLVAARGTVLGIGALATAAALVLEKNVFDNVLFAWAALGSAFGPLLLVRLWCGDVAPRWALAAIVTGGGGAIAGSLAFGSGVADRVVPWAAAALLAWWGSRVARRR